MRQPSVKWVTSSLFALMLLGLPLAAADEPTAEELVRKVIDAESWPAHVDGLLLRMETVHLSTKKRKDAKPETYKQTSTAEFAWDKNRVAFVWDNRGPNFEYYDHRTYDGKIAIAKHSSRTKDQPFQESYILADKTNDIFSNVFSFTWRWGTITRHKGPLVWWRERKTFNNWTEPLEVPVPKQAQIEGRENYHGHECYRLKLFQEYWYIRVSDRQLGGTQLIYTSVEPRTLHAWKSEIAEQPFTTVFEWDKWLETLDPPKRAEAEKRLADRLRPFQKVVVETTFDDYREIAPGCWLPFKESLRQDSQESASISENTTTIVEATVNPILSDHRFHQEIPEGANVSTDWRYQPPIRYTYHANQTEAERQDLAAKLAARMNEGTAILKKTAATIDKHIGQNCPELPQTHWINSPPQKLADLRGKAVALVFWNVGCGPCHQTLDLLNGWEKDADLYGRFVIAVHDHTDDPAAVAEHVKKHQWTIPFVIDADDDSPNGESLKEWAEVAAIPWVLLLDRDGKFVAHGGGYLGSDIFARFNQLCRDGRLTEKSSGK